MKIKKIFVILLILFIGSSFASAETEQTCQTYETKLNVYSSAYAKVSTMLYYETSYDELKKNGDVMEAALSHMRSISSDDETSVKYAFDSLNASDLQTQYAYLKSSKGDFDRYILSDNSLFTEDMNVISKNTNLLEYVNYFNSALGTTYESYYYGECLDTSEKDNNYYNNASVQSDVKASLNNSVSNFCDYLKLSPGIAGFIKMALDIVTYSAMLLAIILGIIDFIKAIGSNEDAGLSKAFKTFMKRIIAVILIFCANIIVVFILNLVPVNGLDVDHAICDELGIANGGIFGG